jgi:predicted N-acetyltransferase YhbS
MEYRPPCCYYLFIMGNQINLSKLTKERFDDAVQVVLVAGLDTKEEIEHHLQHLDAHFVALSDDQVVGVIGWYQDSVNYATAAMGSKFPGEEAYWVGFFAVDKAYQGQGIGAMLFGKIEDDIRRRGADAFWVSSVPETQTYYARHGFRKVMEGEISGKRKIFMVKQL